MADLEMARANVHAVAYNTFVNVGSSRLRKKLYALGEALNSEARIEGHAKLTALVEQGVIESFTPCSAGCVIYPGGLSHADGCENDVNHPVYKARKQAAMEQLPGAPDGFGGWRAASVSLVGPADGGYEWVDEFNRRWNQAVQRGMFGGC